MTQFRTEGQPAFPVADTENDNSAAPSAGEETTKQDDQNANADQTPDPGKPEEGKTENKGEPFNEHPAWKQREETWTKRFNDQEARHQQDLKEAIENLRRELGANKPPAPAAQNNDGADSEVPDWFGGTLEQWNDLNAVIQTRAEKAIEAREAKAREAKEAEDKAVEEATKFMRSEIAAIEADKELNPTGAKIDANKLMKFVLDNHLVDDQNRWNYRAGFRFMKQGEHTRESHAGERKKIAAAATSEGGAEKPPAPFKTREDFQKKRPW